MNEATINDLKQFITAAMSQQLTLQTQEIKDEIRKEVKEELVKIGAKIDDLSASVAEAIDTSNNTTQEQLDNHEQRIAKLEHSAA